MSDTFHCPRRGTITLDRHPHNVPSEDHWREDGTCSYCGSMSQDLFMSRCAEGTITLGPTDKSYKVYVTNRGGDGLRSRGANKLYFQHLTADQMQQFVDLFNAGQLHIGYPGYFYASPFFMTRVRAE